MSESEWVKAVGLPAAPQMPSYRVQKRRNAHRLSLTVPALHSSLAVVPVGTKHGVLQIKGGISRASWDRSTKPIGSKHGVSVAYLHRDLGVGKRGVRSPLWGLPSTKPGTLIRAIDAHGHAHTYRVTRQRSTPKNLLPLDLLRKTGKPTIAIVTCGVRMVKAADGAYHWTGRSITYAVMVR
ncbi:class F sortase [Nocardioides sp. KR10-350]|uniref:class F sortase n=1 Tax=Nocardioides cheoyonin TaxID=3156615 RepID=UPI0032B57516